MKTAPQKIRGAVLELDVKWLSSGGIHGCQLSPSTYCTCLQA